MRKLLLLFVCAFFSMGTRAADISGTGISGATTYPTQSQKVQTLNITTPGALATWVESVTGDNYDTNNPFQGLGGSDDFYELKITGQLNAADLAALNSATCAAFSRFPRIDMSEVTLASDATATDVCGVNFGAASFVKNNTTISGTGAQYIRLPNSMTSEEDVKKMAKMKQDGKNANLKMVGAYDPDNTDMSDSSKKWAEVSMHSFEANNTTAFLAEMNMPTAGNPAIFPRRIKMSGEYGDKDLVNNGTPNFGQGNDAGAEWDFTGAHFADCTIDAITASYYSYDDPFCDGSLVAPSTASNSFCYFSKYTINVVDIKLPDNNMKQLPPLCLSQLGGQNKNGYVALYGQSAFDSNKEEDNSVPLETIIIPECYEEIGQDCFKWGRLRHVYIGGGMKRIQGGAFLKCDYLEDLDFGAGLSNCYVGQLCFSDCQKMKHIALSEGIVSIGSNCFENNKHLESIRLPETLINMGHSCFLNANALNSITIPSNVEKIGQHAFENCPFTDIFLTTTDPAKIPIIWSAGTGFGDGNGFDGACSFNHGHIDGWEGGVDAYKDQIDGVMTWEEAADFYFTNWNGMPVLHYPSQLRDAVHGEISSRYRMSSKDGFGLPLRVDMLKRARIPGTDLGSDGVGKWTRDGWAQFMLMKEYTTDPGSDLFSKEFDDVWYTICFPFDLTDEQLAAAFNETFNIVDFSGVEVTEAAPSDDSQLTMTLHFNTVAKTTYKDVDGNIYTRKMNGNQPIREQHGEYSYNVYTDKNGVEYHHAHVSGKLKNNKTKTFAANTTQPVDLSGDNSDKSGVVVIDGVLAEAGHPYMVHPALGIKLGDPKKRCNFAGITWKPQTQWPAIFEAQKRVVDLGVERGTITDDIKTCVPNADNYLQAAYGDYVGQTYTFIGNSAQYSDEAAAAIGNEPELPGIEPVERTQPTEEEVEALKPEGEPLEAPTPVVQDPDQNTEKYSEDFKELFKTVHCSWRGWNAAEQDQNYLYEFTFGEDLPNTNLDDYYADNNWRTQSPYHGWQAADNTVIKNYLGTPPTAQAFAALKQLAIDYNADKEAYASYKVRWDAYIENRAAWAIYNSMYEERQNWNQQTVHDEWVAEHNEWLNKKTTHDNWIETAKSYQKLIPTGAYFLGRKGIDSYPKFYREIAEVDRPVTERKGGFWTQFTAVIVPNEAAIRGIEAELGAGTTATDAKNVNMVFDEGFMGFYDPTEIKQIVAEAEEKGQEVKYVDIVVSINGQVVRRGSTSLEGLPTGLYIVNGKKYYVK